MPPANNQQGPNNPAYPGQPPAQTPPQGAYGPVGPYPRAPQQAQPTNLSDPDDSRYDFFLKDESKFKSVVPSLKRPGGLSGFTKVIIAAASAMALLIVFAVVISLSRGSGDKTPSLLTIINTQQEITRLSGLGADQLQSVSLQNFVVTAQLTVVTSQKDMIDFYGRHGGKVDAKLLAKASDPRNDAALTAATAAGTYDTTFQSLMDQLLDDYTSEIQQARAQSTTAEGQQLLTTEQKHAELLQTMLTVQ